MKFFFLNEKTYKNNFFLDYFFKNFLFFFYKNMTGNKFIYLIDKYLAETLISSLQKFLSFFFIIFNSTKSLNFNKLTQILLILFIQIALLFIL